MSGASHVVVDGSNIATEGRSVPSLAQLESAVGELHREMPGVEVIVVVDATFAHRIEADERSRFELAALRGEYVYPPAGAIGRGDAFLLRIAQKIDATVLSNDSFQEFHGEHEWLFERGRLLGATPVPGVGWIFVPRTPVRGPKSRIAVRDADRTKTKVEKAIAVATKEAVAPSAPKAQRKGKKRADASRPEEPPPRSVAPRAVNEPLTFISFVAEHPLGTALEGEVESFTSHGAVVRVGEMHCYVPLSGLGSPPPRSAREVLRREERRIFVLTALDPQRRGVELALPEVAVVSGRPSDETVEAEVAMTQAFESSDEIGAADSGDEVHLHIEREPDEEISAQSDGVLPAPKAGRGRRRTPALPPEAAPAPAKPSRARKQAAADAEPPAAPPPARPARAAKKVPSPAPAPEEPAKPTHARRKPAEPASPPPPPAPAARGRGRRRSPEPAPEAVVPVPASRSRARKTSLPEVAASPATPARTGRARKAAAPVAAEPPRAGRARKAAAAPSEPEPGTAAPPVKTTRARKSPARS